MLKPTPTEYEKQKAHYVEVLEGQTPKARAAWVYDEALLLFSKPSIPGLAALRAAFDLVVPQAQAGGLRGHLRDASNQIDHCLDRAVAGTFVSRHTVAAQFLRTVAARRNVTTTQVIKGAGLDPTDARGLSDELRLLEVLAGPGLIRKIERGGLEDCWQLQPRGLAAILEIERRYPKDPRFNIAKDTPALEGNSRLVQSLRARMQGRDKMPVGR